MKIVHDGKINKVLVIGVEPLIISNNLYQRRINVINKNTSNIEHYDQRIFKIGPDFKTQITNSENKVGFEFHDINWIPPAKRVVLEK